MKIWPVDSWCSEVLESLLMSHDLCSLLVYKWGVLWSHLRDYFFNGLVTYLLLNLILSFRLWTMRRFSTRTHLSHTLYKFTTCVCLMANLMPSNLTLFLTVHFCAVHGYAATHMHTPHVHASLPFCHQHAVFSCCSYLDMPFSDSIDRFSIHMYSEQQNCSNN